MNSLPKREMLALPSPEKGFLSLPSPRKLKIDRGARFVSLLFIATSILIAAGILWGANVYYNIDIGKVMVEETQRIVKNGTNYALEVIGMAKFGSDTNYAKFSSEGDLSFTGTADTIEKSDAPLTIRTTGQNLNIQTVTSGTLAISSAGALNLTANAASTLDVGTGNTLTITSQNFRVDSAGNVTVATGQGLDTISAGTLNLGNTTATTINIGNGAATTISIGAGGTLARTFNIGTGSGADTINIGTGTGADVIRIGGGGGTLAIDTTNWDIDTSGNIVTSGSITATGNITTAGNLAVNGGNLTTNATTFNLLNANATTINFGGAMTTLNIGSASGLKIAAPGSLTIQFGASGGFYLQDNAPTTVQYLTIGTDGTLTLLSKSGSEIVLNPGGSSSGIVRVAPGDQFYIGDVLVMGTNQEIIRGVVPIFGFDLPAQTATTSFVQVSRIVENYPFPTSIPGTVREHKFIIRYASATTTAGTTWRVYDTDHGTTIATFSVPATESTDLNSGQIYITGAVTIPTDGTDWRLDVQTSGAAIRIYQIFLVAVDRVD
jgi:hypothetical protein